MKLDRSMPLFPRGLRVLFSSYPQTMPKFLERRAFRRKALERNTLLCILKDNSYHDF